MKFKGKLPAILQAFQILLRLTLFSISPAGQQTCDCADGGPEGYCVKQNEGCVGYKKRPMPTECRGQGVCICQYSINDKSIIIVDVAVLPLASNVLERRQV